ncbi:MAG: glycosyltransferase family 2 protein [Planctomycetales bacterium]|nr:glycosyltransferase family 2 protein [Planctomycetales bacterium]
MKPNSRSTNTSFVLVVIVNYRTPHDACNTLASIAPEIEKLPNMRVVVADNASGDDSVSQVQQTIEANQWVWATVMPLNKNGGFAAGNNAVVRHDLAQNLPFDYVLLLNPDTIVKSHAVLDLVEYLDANPSVGIAGANVSLMDQSPHTAARRLPSPVSEFTSQTRLGIICNALKRFDVSVPIEDSDEVECQWVCGAAMMVRREVFEKIGLMDEGYFLYFEEVDFCWRAIEAGFRVVVVPDSHIVHLEGAATGINQTKQRRGQYWYNSRRRFLLKRYGIAGLLAADVAFVCGRLIGGLNDLLHLRSPYPQDPRWFTWDVLVGDAQALCCGNPSGGPPLID